MSPEAIGTGGVPTPTSLVFVNSKLLVSRSQNATMFGLPQVGEDTCEWNLAIPVDDGDRVGLFGLDIPVLSM